MSEPIPLRDEHSPLGLVGTRQREREREREIESLLGRGRKRKKKKKKVTTTLDAWLGPGLVWRRRLARNYAYFVFEYNLLSLQRQSHGQSQATLVCSSLVGWFLLVFALLQPLPPPPDAFISLFRRVAIHASSPPRLGFDHLSLSLSLSLTDRCRAYRSARCTRQPKHATRVRRADHATLT